MSRDKENIVRRIVEYVASSGCPLDLIHSRSIVPFHGVLDWWNGEIEAAERGDKEDDIDPGTHMAMAAAVLSFQYASIAHAITGGLNNETRRSIATRFIAHLEDLAGGDVLPTRADIDDIKKTIPARGRIH